LILVEADDSGGAEPKPKGPYLDKAGLAYDEKENP
jgi:hypothetical protein